MSRATTKNVASIVGKDGKVIPFDRATAPSIWGAMGQRDNPKK